MIGKVLNQITEINASAFLKLLVCACIGLSGCESSSSNHQSAPPVAYPTAQPQVMPVQSASIPDEKFNVAFAIVPYVYVDKSSVYDDESMSYKSLNQAMRTAFRKKGMRVAGDDKLDLFTLELKRLSPAYHNLNDIIIKTKLLDYAKRSTHIDFLVTGLCKINVSKGKKNWDARIELLGSIRDTRGGHVVDEPFELKPVFSHPDLDTLIEEAPAITARMLADSLKIQRLIEDIRHEMTIFVYKGDQPEFDQRVSLALRKYGTLISADNIKTPNGKLLGMELRYYSKMLSRVDFAFPILISEKLGIEVDCAANNSTIGIAPLPAPLGTPHPKLESIRKEVDVTQSKNLDY